MTKKDTRNTERWVLLPLKILSFFGSCFFFFSTLCVDSSLALHPLNIGISKSCPLSSDFTPGWVWSCPSFSIPNVNDLVWATSFSRLPFHWPSVLQVPPHLLLSPQTVARTGSLKGICIMCHSQKGICVMCHSLKGICVIQSSLPYSQSSSGPPWSSRQSPNPSAYPSQSGPSAWSGSHPAISHGRLVLHLLVAVSSPGLSLYPWCRPSWLTGTPLPLRHLLTHSRPLNLSLCVPIFYFHYWYLYILPVFYSSVSPMVYQFHSSFQKAQLLASFICVLFFISVFSALVSIPSFLYFLYFYCFSLSNFLQ